MGVFRNKFLIKLITIVCLFLIVLSFGTHRVYATEFNETWGGTLIQPVVELLVAIGDGAMDILHSSIVGQDLTLIKIAGEDDWSTIWKMVVIVIVGLAIAAVVIYFGGGIIAAVLGKAATAVAGATVAAGVVSTTTKVAIFGGIVLGSVFVYKVRFYMVS